MGKIRLVLVKNQNQNWLKIGLNRSRNWRTLLSANIETKQSETIVERLYFLSLDLTLVFYMKKWMNSHTFKQTHTHSSPPFHQIKNHLGKFKPFLFYVHFMYINVSSILFHLWPQFVAISTAPPTNKWFYWLSFTFYRSSITKTQYTKLRSYSLLNV